MLQGRIFEVVLFYIFNIFALICNGPIVKFDDYLTGIHSRVIASLNLWTFLGLLIVVTSPSNNGVASGGGRARPEVETISLYYLFIYFFLFR